MNRMSATKARNHERSSGGLDSCFRVFVADQRDEMTSSGPPAQRGPRPAIVRLRAPKLDLSKSSFGFSRALAGSFGNSRELQPAVSYGHAEARRAGLAILRPTVGARAPDSRDSLVHRQPEGIDRDCSLSCKVAVELAEHPSVLTAWFAT